MSLTIEDTLRQAQVPEILYKYRTWSDKYHKRLLSNKEIFFASPKAFEDTEDCRNIIRYDLLTDHQLYEYYIHKSKQDNKILLHRNQRKYAREMVKKTPFKNQVLLSKVTNQMQEIYFNITGVFSMTANPSNIALWDLYAAKLKGFCIGLDSKVLANHIGSCGPIKYPKELPVILPEPSDCAKTSAQC